MSTRARRLDQTVEGRIHEVIVEAVKFACEALERRTLLSVLTDGQPEWIEQGPGPAAVLPVQGTWASGAVDAVAVDPTDPTDNRVFVATVNGGVWRTDNATEANPNWTPLTDHWRSGAMTSIAISPLNSNTVFAGLGTRSNANDGIFDAGILRSADGGANWTHVGESTFAGNFVEEIVPTTLIDGTTAKQVVLVAAFGTNGGIYRSIDGGITFPQRVLGGPNGATSIVRDPGSSSRFYAALPQFGVFRSEDGGQTWVNVSPSPTIPFRRSLLSVSPVVDPSTEL